MALPPLASVADLEALLGRELTEAESTRAEVLLKQASARVRAYTRDTFSFVANDIVVTRPVGTQVRLRNPPVTAVHEVVAVSGYATVPDLLMPSASWSWDGIDLVDVSPPGAGTFVSLPELWSDPSALASYRVVYSHGYEQVPDDVVSVVCNMVLRVLLAPSQTPGLVSERIGQYNYQMQQGTGSPGAVLRLNADDKADLALYRVSATTIQTTAA